MQKYYLTIDQELTSKSKVIKNNFDYKDVTFCNFAYISCYITLHFCSYKKNLLYLHFMY